MQPRLNDEKKSRDIEEYLKIKTDGKDGIKKSHKTLSEKFTEILIKV